MHWELEFADIFDDQGGFDLIVGNPPWIKLSWNEQNILCESNPLLAVKKTSAAEVTKIRDNELQNQTVLKTYFEEYVSLAGMQNYLDSKQNYLIH